MFFDKAELDLELTQKVEIDGVEEEQGVIYVDGNLGNGFHISNSGANCQVVYDHNGRFMIDGECTHYWLESTQVNS